MSEDAPNESSLHLLSEDAVAAFAICLSILRRHEGAQVSTDDPKEAIRLVLASVTHAVELATEDAIAEGRVVDPYGDDVVRSRGLVSYARDLLAHGERAALCLSLGRDPNGELLASSRIVVDGGVVPGTLRGLRPEAAEDLVMQVVRLAGSLPDAISIDPGWSLLGIGRLDVETGGDKLELRVVPA